MDQISFTSFYAELTKLSSPRYEREIASGNVSRSAISPGVPDGAGPISRKLTRTQLAAPASVDPQMLNRRRLINEKVFNTQMVNPSLSGVQGVSAHGKMFPGMGPGMHMGEIYVPPESGRFIRGIGSGFVGRMRATASAIAPGLAGKILPGSVPQDATLNRAIMAHEFGEASVATGAARMNPHASHLGVRPILEENQATRGDPGAISEMAKARRAHPDDKVVQKAIRQAGGTPDAPLAMGGKQERAVEKILKKNVSSITPAARQKAVIMSVAGNDVGYVPESVKQVSKKIPQVAESVKSSVEDLNLKRGVVAVRRMFRGASRLGNFIKKGL